MKHKNNFLLPGIDTQSRAQARKERRKKTFKEESDYWRLKYRKKQLELSEHSESEEDSPFDPMKDPDMDQRTKF